MAERKEQTATTFWSSPENTIALKQWMSEHGLKNSQALPYILEILKLSDSRQAMPDRQKEIDTFQNELGKILTMYQSSLVVTEDTEARIRSEFQDRITASETALKGLKEKLDTAVAERNDARKAIEANEEQMKMLLDNIAKKDEEIKLKEQALSDKTELINALQLRMTNITDKINQADKETKQFKELQRLLNFEKSKTATLQNEMILQKARAENDKREAVLKERAEAQTRMETLIAKYTNMKSSSETSIPKIILP